MPHRTVPVALFIYNRAEQLAGTLACLRANRVPLIHAFADGPRDPGQVEAVAAARRLVRAVDWCELILHEQAENLGLGRSIRSGVNRMLKDYDRVIVFEDDLICVPGTYAYLAAALEQYRDDEAVMSVTGWTHPRVTPADVTDQPYFDRRAECLVWGTWARAWSGMGRDAKTLMLECEARGIDIYDYGADLPAMARDEVTRNIWAVRWIYWHIVNGGLCLRPPWSMVEHMGAGALATNVIEDSYWRNLPLEPAPILPVEWPPALEHPECARLWQGACGGKPGWRTGLRTTLRRMLSACRTDRGVG